MSSNSVNKTFVSTQVIQIGEPRKKSTSSKGSPSHSPVASAHTVSTSKDDFVPRPYTFRIKGKEVGPDGVVARMPPYWMLMDHTLGVIWSVCSPKYKDMPIGITQLQWALYMLKSVKTRRGDYTTDVKQLIDNIEDRLLDQYAAIAKSSKALLDGDDNKNKSINTTSFHSTRLRKEMSTPKRNLQKRSSKLHATLAPGEAETEVSAVDGDVPTPQHDDSIYLTAEEGMVAAMDETSITYHDFSSGLKASNNATMNSTYRSGAAGRANDDFQSFLEMRNEHFLYNSGQGQDESISSTYDEVMKLCPPPESMRPTPLCSRTSAAKKTLFPDDDEDDKEADKSEAGEKLIVDIRSKLPPVVSKEETMLFLKQLRREQVTRIKNEMTRLRAIEEFMRKVDDVNFHPLMDQNASRRLEEIERLESSKL